MIHPIPSGTRDVLPEEPREVRAITDALRGVFERHGYGEIYTPALEYESVLARADMAEAKPAYRVFDESGAVLALRSDMTVPIARVVATRYAGNEPPMRFCYFAHCYRGVRPQRGQPRELLQAGIELMGSPARRASSYSTCPSGVAAPACSPRCPPRHRRPSRGCAACTSCSSRPSPRG